MKCLLFLKTLPSHGFSEFSTILPFTSLASAFLSVLFFPSSILNAGNLQVSIFSLICPLKCGHPSPVTDGSYLPVILKMAVVSEALSEPPVLWRLVWVNTSFSWWHKLSHVLSFHMGHVWVAPVGHMMPVVGLKRSMSPLRMLLVFWTPLWSSCFLIL